MRDITPTSYFLKVWGVEKDSWDRAVPLVFEVRGLKNRKSLRFTFLCVLSKSSSCTWVKKIVEIYCVIMGKSVSWVFDFSPTVHITQATKGWEMK